MLFGEISSFAVECDVLQEPGYASDEPFGHLAMWAGGVRIGEFEDVTMLSAAARVLGGMARYEGRRRMAGLLAASTEDAFRTVYDAMFGLMERDLETMEKDYEEFSRFVVCPNGIESFDGWIAILIEGEGSNRFIWEDLGKDIHEVQLVSGELGIAVRGFVAWIEGLSARRAEA